MSIEFPADRPDIDDATLVAQVVQGDRHAFEALYDRHHLPIFRTALAITRDRGAAEELLQETFLRAYRYIGRVCLAPDASLKPWLHRIAINLAYDWTARRRTALRPLDDMDERIAAHTVSPEREAEQREVECLVDDAIACLPFKQRVVVILFYLHDMDMDEIAATLNLPAGTVKSRLFYGRARLRERLKTDARLPATLEMQYA